MNVKQFYDKSLAHGSYAIESEGRMALVDPARDPQPYLDYAKGLNAHIIAVFETHPHADFISSHLDFQKNHGAKIYINPKTGARYEHEPLEQGDEVKIGAVIIRALFTPGHSPDHNSYLLLDEDNRQYAVFTGDSLFVGDVGRPDLREGVGHIQHSRNELAAMMYDSLRNIFAGLEDDVIVFPAHGAGSLCGKNMSDDRSSTIGREKSENWAFQLKDRKEFVESYLEGQGFIPKYFPYDVELNREGAGALSSGLARIPRLTDSSQLNPGRLIIDTRDQLLFKKGHYTGAINIMSKGEDKFETWLGSIVDPEESYYIVSENEEALEKVLHRTAKIGYDCRVLGALVYEGKGKATVPELNTDQFSRHPENYTIVDIRNKSELKSGKLFDRAIGMPLPELREQVMELPMDKPVVVHCAGGYRSAAGSSIVSKYHKDLLVYDLSEEVKRFQD